ncbi:ADP-ribosylglycohydrolase [Bacillus sp. OV166]|nr:ADP-ribosylglycohydrolase [Bacillus sp. OV166]
MLDKVKGGLFGVAIGDALGATTEFMSPEEIKKEYGRVTSIIGGGVWKVEPGETTDDIKRFYVTVKEEKRRVRSHREVLNKIS